ncbi:uncharacterized protein I303_107109 [Kwoniella dejecticola CBS 10117]|uniref:LysM domain-containing protein n=1 Tax=Kwoniella dejecticola CBS 10117 TaxID=1296121 RepID=A0A1A5ZYR6_9TREE|nr:uncharacterized protein I303_06511 [Kwoniella dejecticola CBS 10117]OBR82953.1 hypothetical protein I303_06511 [Kwoniella dejecticola CBS 10117]
MQASSSSYSLSSTPPPESEIWGPFDPNGGAESPSSSPQMGRRTLVKRKNGQSSSSNTPQIPSSSSASPSGDEGRGSSDPAIPHRISEQTKKHPLSGPTPPNIHTDILGDISRPNLTRLTSATERQVAESSRSGSEYGGGSARGSFDLLRMTPGGADESREVEVLIHTIKPNESLAGIALLYGIDLATLRKSNKLWSSDPIHIRTHLYVPLESCRWNKAKETLVRGPGEGQVTLMPKKDKGKGKEVDLALPNGSIGIGLGLKDEHHHLLNGLSESSDNLDIPSGSREVDIGLSPGSSTTDLASTFLPSTNPSYNHDHSSPPTSTAPLGSMHEDMTSPRILDVVRIPSSELRFFPKPNKPPDRRSLDYPRGSLEILRGNGDQSQSQGGSRGTRSRSNTASSPLKMSNGIDDLFNARDSIEDTSMREQARSGRGSSQQLQRKHDDSGPTIINNLFTLPPSLSRAHISDLSDSSTNHITRSKSTVVKLRPPSSTLPSSHNRQSSSGIQGKLMDFFTVPPPPPSQQPFSASALGNSAHAQTVGRGKQDRARLPIPMPMQNGLQRKPIVTSKSSGGGAAQAKQKERQNQESMELKTRYSDLGLDLGIGGLGIDSGLRSGEVKRGGSLGRQDNLDKGNKQD